MKPKSIRSAFALAVFFLLIGSIGCDPKSTAPNNGGNMAPTAAPTIAQCPAPDVLNDLILAKIKLSHAAQYPYINTRTTANELFLLGYTQNAGELTNINNTITALLVEKGCPTLPRDECHFWRTVPPNGHYLRRNQGGGCTSPYVECGTICLPPPETCDGVRP